MGYKRVGDKIVYTSPLAEAQAVGVAPAEKQPAKRQKNSKKK
jgi:hypothetical protein